MLACDRCLPQCDEELGWAVEIRHLEVGGADSFWVVRVGAGAPWQVIAGREPRCLHVVLLVLDSVLSSQLPQLGLGCKLSKSGACVTDLGWLGSRGAQS